MHDNVYCNHTTFYIQRTRIQNTQFAVYISDTPVTLKQGQGHQPLITSVGPKQGYNLTKFKISCFNGVREKANVNVFFPKLRKYEYVRWSEKVIHSWSTWCTQQSYYFSVPVGSPSRGGDVTVYVWHKPTELAHSFLFCSCVYFCLYGPFNCISFHKFSRQLSAFSLCSSTLISALLVLLTIYVLLKVSFSPDIILRGWLGSKLQLTINFKPSRIRT